jgi:hypothetical protein
MQSGEPLEIPRRDCEGLDPVVFAIQAERLSIAAPLHWKEQLVSVGGFDESLPCAQEYDLHIRLACRGATWRHLPEVLYTVRSRPNSVSSDSLGVLDLHVYILSKARSMLDSNCEAAAMALHAMAGKRASDARHYVRMGEGARARRYFAEARRFHDSGGLDIAYSRCVLYLRRVLGVSLTEKLVHIRRSIRGPKYYSGDHIL